MLRVTVALAVALAGFASATSVPEQLLKRQSTAALTDADILNFALTLEHLENTFYAQGLKNYTSDQFKAASSLGGITQPNIAQIGSDEASHVALLTGALSAAGATPVKACTYAFPSTDAHSFLGLAQVLEGVGVAAYSGAAGFIQNKDYLEVAANILTVEARHNAFIRLTNGYSAFPSPYDVGLSPRAIVSLAGAFFVSCPDGSAPTIQPFPAATLTSTNATLGSTLKVSVNSTLTSGNQTLYCAFASGVQSAFSPYKDGSCTLPSQNITGGQIYGLITTAQNISDSSVVAGPWIMDLDTANNTAVSSSTNAAAGNSQSNAKSGASIVGMSGAAAIFGAIAAFAGLA